MTTSNTAEIEALRNAVLLLSHALRLNTTAPAFDQGFEPWPRCPYGVLDRTREAIGRLALTSRTLCAAVVLLDPAAGDAHLIDQGELLARFEVLAHQPMTSGSETG